MIKFLFILMASSSFLTIAASEKVNLEHLVISIEEIAKDMQSIEKRVDNISQQSYEAKVATLEHEEYINLLKKEIEVLTRRLRYSKPSMIPNLEYTNSPSERIAEYYSVNAGAGLRVRSSSSINSKVIDLLKDKASVYAMCTDAEDWCYLPDRKGFVYKKYLQKKD